MTAAKSGFVLRRGDLYHGPRSASMVTAPESARVWSDRGSAREQADALNATPDPLLPLWTVERLVPEGSVR